jgi:hypothetical protein
MGIVELNSCSKKTCVMLHWQGKKRNCVVQRKRNIQKLPNIDLQESIFQELKNRRIIQETLTLCLFG